MGLKNSDLVQEGWNGSEMDHQMPNSSMYISTASKETTEGWHLLGFVCVEHKGVFTAFLEQLDGLWYPLHHELHLLVAVV